MVQEWRAIFIASMNLDLRVFGPSERLCFISRPCYIFEERSNIISSPDIPFMDTHLDENTGPEFLKVGHIFAAANAVALFVSLPVKWSSNAFRRIKVEQSCSSFGLLQFCSSHLTDTRSYIIPLITLISAYHEFIASRRESSDLLSHICISLS